MKKLRLVVDNTVENLKKVEVDLEDRAEPSDEKDELLGYLAFLAEQVGEGECGGLAVVTIASDGKSTSSLYTPSCVDNLHMVLCGLDLLSDRIKDECLIVD